MKLFNTRRKDSITIKKKYTQLHIFSQIGEIYTIYYTHTLAARLKDRNKGIKCLPIKRKIESHRTVSTFAIRTSQRSDQKLQKSLPLPTLEEIMNIKKEIKIYG